MPLNKINLFKNKIKIFPFTCFWFTLQSLPNNVITNSMKILAYTIQLLGQDTVIKTQQDLNKELKATRDRLKNVEQIGTEGYNNTQNELAKLKAVQKAFSEDLRTQTRQAIIDLDKQEGSYKALQAQLTNLRAEFRLLSRADRESEIGRTIIAQIQNIDKELRAIDGSMKIFVRNVGNYTSAFDELKQTLESIDPEVISEGILSIVEGATGVTLTFDLIKQGVQFVRDLTDEFTNLNREFALLTQLEGDQLNGFTQEALTLSKTFGEETGDVGQAANTLIKQLGVTSEEAFQILETGFLSGANAGGELLDNIREYAPQIDAAGLSGEQFIGILQQQATDGVFSDKGIDLVKEFGLRVRELTPATEEALEAIGINAEEVAKIIDEDGIGGAFTAVQGKLQEFEGDSRVVGQVLADVFGGAGEDAGIEFIKTLDLTTESYDELINSESEAVRVRQEQLQLNRKFTAAQAELTATLASQSERFRVLGQEVLVVVLENLVKFLEIIKAIPQFVRDNQTEIIGLGIAILGLNANVIRATASILINRGVLVAQAAATRAVTIAQAAFNVALRNNPVGLVIIAVGALVAIFGRLYKESQTVRAGIAGIVNIGREAFNIVKDIATAFIEGFGQLSEGNFKDAFQSFSKGLLQVNPVTGAAIAGARLANAYTEGYNNKVDEETVASLERQRGILEAELDKQGVAVGNKAEKTGAKVGEGFNKGIKQTDEQLKEALTSLQRTQTAIIDSINRAALDGTGTEALTARLAAVTNKVNQARAELETGLRGQTALTEFARLEAEKFAKVLETDLQGSLEKFNEELTTESRDAWQEFNEQVDLAQQKAREFRAATDEFINSGIDPQLEQAREQVDQNDPTRETLEGESTALGIGDEELREAEINRLRLEAEQQYNEERLALAEIGSEEYLQIQNDIAQQEIEIRRQAEETKTNLQERAFDVAENITSGITSLIGDEDKAREVSQKVNEKITAAQILLSQKRIIQTNLEILANNIKAVSEGAKIPFPANLIAIGSIIAAIATGITQVKKLASFAEGGELNSTGGIVRMGKPAIGRSHAGGGIQTTLNGRRVEIEGGEFTDRDESGNAFVISRQNTKRYRSILSAVGGRSFTGKGRILRGALTGSLGGILRDGGVISGTDNSLVPSAAVAFANQDTTAASNTTTGEVQLSEDSIRFLAEEVGGRVFTASKEGTRDGVEEAQLMNERINRLQEEQ